MLNSNKMFKSVVPVSLCICARKMYICNYELASLMLLAEKDIKINLNKIFKMIIKLRLFKFGPNL